MTPLVFVPATLDRPVGSSPNKEATGMTLLTKALKPFHHDGVPNAHAHFTIYATEASTRLL